MTRTLRNRLKSAIILGLTFVCLVSGGCHWALQNPSAGSQVFPASLEKLPPAAPPVDPPLVEAENSPAPAPGPWPATPAAAASAKAPTAPAKQASARPMNLPECRSLTLVNNPDLQVEIWEQIAKKSFADGSFLKIFPHPGAAAELSNRENLLYPYGDAEDFGLSAPLKKATWRYYVEARWSPTDALQAFYLSRNDCNDSVKANYQRLRAAQKMVGAVDAAYYRLLSLQQCLPLAERLSNIRANVAQQAKELRQDRLTDLEEHLRTEEKASAARFRLTRIRTELQRQQIMLAGLMGLPAQTQPGGAFYVTGGLESPNSNFDTNELEIQALKSRPEAQAEGLSNLNSVNDIKRAAVKYLPKTSAFYRYGRDNGYQRPDKNISEFGVLMYLDLLEWATNVRDMNGLKAKQIKGEHRMAAVALAISSEVRIAALRCLEAQEELQTLAAAIERGRKQLQLARGKAKVGILETVAVEDAQGNLLQEEVDRIRALGEANARVAELACAMGTNYNDGLPCR